MAVHVYFIHNQKVLTSCFKLSLPRRIFDSDELKQLIFEKLYLSSNVKVLYVSTIEEGKAIKLSKSQLETQRFKGNSEIQVLLGVHRVKNRPELPINPNIVTVNQKNFHDILDGVKYNLGEGHSRKNHCQRLICEFFSYKSSQPQSATQESEAEETVEETLQLPAVVRDSQVEHHEHVEDSSPGITRDHLEEEYVRSRSLGAPRRLPRLTAQQIKEQNKLKELTLMEIIPNSADSKYLLHGMANKWNDTRFYQALSNCLAYVIFTRSSLRTKTAVYDVILHLLEPHPHLDIRELIGPISSRLTNRLYYMRTHIATT